MIRADKIVGLLFIAVALAGAAVTLGWPSMRGLAFGPSFFPRIIFAMMFIGGLVLVLRKAPPFPDELVAFVEGDGSPPHPTGAVVLTPLFDDRQHVVFVGAVVLGLIVYVALFDLLGFLPLTIAFCFMTVCLSGGGWIDSAIFSVVFTFAVQWSFETILRVPLPHGSLSW